MIMSRKANYQGFTSFVGEKNGRKKKRARKLLLEKLKNRHGSFDLINLNQMPAEIEINFAKNPLTGK